MTATSTGTSTRYDHKVEVPEGQSGVVRVVRFTVPEKSWQNMRLAFDGRHCIPGEYTKLTEGGRLWMSDTTAEWYDHFEAVSQIRRRGGRVLINGLGLGMVVKAALACENVEHVDVVESNEDVIKLVGPTYAGERCTIHHADAYGQAKAWSPGTRWTVAWHDIWIDINEDNLPSMAKLKRSYGRRVDWQGCWGQGDILRRRRREAGRWW